MTPKRFLFFTTVVACFILSCKKQIGDNEHPEFIGKWEATDALNSKFYSFDIPPDGKGEFVNDGFKIKGKIKIGNDKLAVGLKRFKIISAPATDYSMDTNTLSQYPYYERPFVTMTLEVSGHDEKFFKRRD
jgi:hypothetical protein